VSTNKKVNGGSVTRSEANVTVVSKFPYPLNLKGYNKYSYHLLPCQIKILHNENKRNLLSSFSFFSSYLKFLLMKQMINSEIEVSRWQRFHYDDWSEENMSFRDWSPSSVFDLLEDDAWFFFSFRLEIRIIAETEMKCEAILWRIRFRSPWWRSASPRH